jgi:hypothetical protein
MDPREIDRLKKLLALCDSANDGERNNAIAAAGALLKRHGKSMVDLPAILGGATAGKGRAEEEAAHWRTMYQSSVRTQKGYEDTLETYKSILETDRRLREMQIAAAERRGREQAAAEMRAQGYEAKRATWRGQERAQRAAPERREQEAWAQRPRMAARERAETAAWAHAVVKKAEAKHHAQEQRGAGEADRVRLRIQVQEQAVAAGYAPKDAISYVRRGLLVQIQARAAQDVPKKKQRRKAA